MTLLEIMERVGSRRPEYVKALVNDALEEIADLIPERTTGEFINVVADQRFYNLPTAAIRVLGVYARYDSDGRYVRIPGVSNIILEKPTTATSSSVSDVEIIVV